MRVLGFFVLALIGWVGCKHAEPPPQDASSVTAESPPAVEAAATAPLFEGLGDFSHPITVSSPLAQRYFDQGMILSFGFNHAEAERSFRYAAELDESCAMCWWGVAYVLGPNINAPMSPEAGAQAWEALGRAHALAPKVSAKEQDYITTLSARYVEAPTEDRTALNEAYAEAMKQLAAKYPDDVDATILAVEALMDLHPWNFYDFKTGEARPWTPEILALLEGQSGRSRSRPGLHHSMSRAGHLPTRLPPAQLSFPIAHRVSRGP